jgi:peptidoglycan/LPS O-acetylase OafA/YrhL
MNASIAEKMIQTGGRSSGFDYLRIGLAFSVIVTHSTSTSYGFDADKAIWSGLPSIYMHAILPMFFALSGFLVAGSLERCPTLISFYGLRILRIVPALFVEVVMSALIFGPILSRLDMSAYFADIKFYTYFLNIVGDIHYFLPGVFTDNPIPFAVNYQLWTVPFELECYLALGALAVVGIMANRKLLLAVVILGQALWGYEALKHSESGAQVGATGPLLVLAFLTGVLFYLYRNEIKLKPYLLALACLASAGLMLLPYGVYYSVVPATYVTVYLGLTNPKKPRFIFDGDYSYGLYLYGFPIQQAFASLGPWAQHWYLNLAVSASGALAVAYFSWNYIEKPALALRRLLPGIERKLIGLVGVTPPEPSGAVVEARS